MWIKFCGATRIADAIAVARSGADALGLNFFPASKRFVTIETACERMATATVTPRALRESSRRRAERRRRRRG